MIWFWLLFVCLLLGQLQRVQLTPFIAFYAHDLVMALFVSWQLLQAERRKKIKFLFNKIFQKAKSKKLFLIFLSWGLLGLLVNSAIFGLNLKPWLYLARVSLYFAFSLIFITRFRADKTKKFILGLGLGWAVLGLAQYIFLPDLRWINLPGWDDHYYRLAGTLLDPNFTGILLVMAFVNLDAWTKSKKHWWLGSIFLAAAILLTYSRASYLALALVLGLNFLKTWKNGGQRRKNSWRYAVIALSFLLFIPFLPKPGGEGVNLKRTSTIESRLATNQNVLSQLTSWQKILGKGLFWPSVNQSNQSSQAIHAQFPDNLFVFILSSTGIVGLILFVFLLIKLIVFLKKEGGWATLILFLSVLLHAQFNHTLFEPFVFLSLNLSLLSYSSKETVRS